MPSSCHDKLNVPRADNSVVTHVDYSARVQTVHQETKPPYHTLISRFKERTGCSVLVNTSFNVRGEPINTRLAVAGMMSEVRLDNARPRVDAEGYGENLSSIARWAKERDIRLVFILVSDSPNETSSLWQGIRRLADEDYEQVIAYLMYARDLASRYLAHAYAEMGPAAEALKDALVSVHGGSIVLESECNGIMRDGQFGAQLLDAANELNKMTGTYFDFCHFDAQDHALVGKLAAGLIKVARNSRDANGH